MLYIPRLRWTAWLLCSVVLVGCVDSDARYPAVNPFDLERYMGKWYEIARLDNGFEQGLSNVSVEYSVDDAERIRFKARGLVHAAGQWRLQSGTLEFAEDEDRAQFKLSLNKNMKTPYTVLALDDDYSCALVTAGQGDYLWLMSRSTTIAPSTSRRMLDKARSLGFPVNKLMFIDQNRPNH